MWYIESVFSETLCTEREDYLEETLFLVKMEERIAKLKFLWAALFFLAY